MLKKSRIDREVLNYFTGSRHRVVVVLAIVLTACSPVEKSPLERPQVVSMVTLIGSPDLYDHKFVQTIGIYANEHENVSIFLSKADYDARILANAIWLEGADNAPRSSQHPATEGEYVLVEGVFSRSAKGYLGLFSGSITQVKRLESWDISPPVE